MDINILLTLQEFRNGIGGILADFLKQITYLADSKTVLVIMAVVYWGVSKKFGTFLLMGWNANRLVNGFLKITVCAYRPWIRDARIRPFGNAIRSATGYSFPSGHSTNSASVCGGGMLWREFPGTLRILFGVVVVLVPFSRLYLGVHTPQDVICGTVIGLLVMWLTMKLLLKIEKHPEKDWIVPAVGLVLAAALGAYAALKPYPRDYDAAGKLLVDGAKMANDTFKCVGWVSGFLIGWLLERRFVGFSTDVPGTRKAARIVAGVPGYYAVSLIPAALLKNLWAKPAVTTATCFIQMFCIVFVFPLVFKCLEGRKTKSGPEER